MNKTELKAGDWVKIDPKRFEQSDNSLQLN